MNDDWRKKGKCATGDPRDWDSESLAHLEDKRLKAKVAMRRCEGCVVFLECAADAIKPMYAADGLKLYTTGVIRAGMVI